MDNPMSDDERNILRRLNGKVSTHDLSEMLMAIAGQLERSGQIIPAKVATLAASRLLNASESVH